MIYEAVSIKKYNDKFSSKIMSIYKIEFLLLT